MALSIRKKCHYAFTLQVLLPTTAYVLRLRAPPARALLRAGCCVALGSDFNPNAFCYAMPTVMNMACVLFGMSMPEALVAATLHAAHSVSRGRTHGALAVRDGETKQKPKSQKTKIME